MGRMFNLGEKVAKINLQGRVLYEEPLAKHTTFAVGGPAEVMVFPATVDDLQVIGKFCQEDDVPLFVLGKGANLLASDQGLRGVTVNLTTLNSWHFEGNLFHVQAGLSIDTAVELCRDRGVSALEAFYGMPSSVGGAFWMNARCYGREASEVFVRALVLDSEKGLYEVSFPASAWSYKVSPFQTLPGIIVEVTVQTVPQDRDTLQTIMNTNYNDRLQKGHYRLPCAGSIFKNDRRFHDPSGVIIDRCGLKGLRRGHAVVSDWHGNIIVNEGGATASDLRTLIKDVQQRVYDQTGFLLEEEVLYIGDWAPLT